MKNAIYIIFVLLVALVLLISCNRRDDIPEEVVTPEDFVTETTEESASTSEVPDNIVVVCTCDADNKPRKTPREKTPK